MEKVKLISHALSLPLPYHRPQHLPEDGQDEVIQEGGQEIVLSHLEEEVREDIESEDEGTMFLDLTTIDHNSAMAEVYIALI